MENSLLSSFCQKRNKHLLPPEVLLSCDVRELFMQCHDIVTFLLACCFCLVVPLLLYFEDCGRLTAYIVFVCFHFFVCMCVCPRVRVCACVRARACNWALFWKVEDNLQESILSFHHVNFWDPTQGVSLGSKQFYLMNHLVPKIRFRKDSCYLKEIILMLYLSASCLYRADNYRTINLCSRSSRFCAVCIGLSYRTETQ